MTARGTEEVRRDLPGLLPRLWRFALYLSRDNATAEDLVQSTCVRALERAGQYDAGSRLDSWAFTIMSSIWKNELRSRSTRQRHAQQLDLKEPPQEVSLPDMTIRAREVLSELQKLPDAQRATVALVYVEGYSYRETAHILDIPIGTVMSRLANARKALSHLNSDQPQRNAKKGAESR